MLRQGRFGAFLLTGGLLIMVEQTVYVCERKWRRDLSIVVELVDFSLDIWKDNYNLKASLPQLPIDWTVYKTFHISAQESIDIYAEITILWSRSGVIILKVCGCYCPPCMLLVLGYMNRVWSNRQEITILQHAYFTVGCFQLKIFSMNEVCGWAISTRGVCKPWHISRWQP